MPKFGKRSEANLATCHPDLVAIAREAIKEVDFTIIEGHRGKAAQDRAVAAGASRTPWPRSKHNRKPSQAFDFIPSPFNGWKDLEAFKRVGEALKAVAAKRGIVVSYGGDWKTFKDYPHFQLGL